MSAYGAVLGTGILTPHGAAAMYSVVALLVLIGDVWIAVLIYAAYGATRALVTTIAGIASIRFGVMPFERGFQNARRYWRPVLGAVSILAAAILFL
jgi:hypothetical protein